jgi:KDO2-lipid IV(A) lauroyltransferase
LTPRTITLWLGSLLGQILYTCGVYRKVVQTNFDHVGLWNDSQKKRIIPKLYQNIGRYAADFLRKGKHPPYRVANLHLLDECHQRGKGTLVVLAHFGNWELLASLFGSKVNNLNVIAMPMRNPLVEKWLHSKRDATAVKTIYTKNALRGMLEALRKNEFTAILIDQSLRMGTPAPFLGKTASTVRTAAGLVRKMKSTVLPVYALLQSDGSYDIHLSIAEPPANENNDDEETIITKIQTQHNDIISGWIKEHPEHWFGWFHRRFKGYIDYK